MASTPDYATTFGTLAANSMLVLASDKGSSLPKETLELIWRTQESNIDIAIELARVHGVGQQAAAVYRRLVKSRRNELEAAGPTNIMIVSFINMKALLLERGL